jgi:hypothetical protein
MSIVGSQLTDLRQTAEAAEAIHSLQLSLGGHERVPDLAWDFAYSLVDAIENADETWLASHDPEYRDLLLRSALTITHGYRDREAPQARRYLMLGFQRCVEVLDRIAEGEVVSPLRSPQDVAQWLAHAIEAPQSEIAGLVGTSTKTFFSRWMTGETTPDGEEARRLRLVAQLVNQLRFSLTNAGVLHWFDRSQPPLGDRTPRQALDDPEATPLLYQLATGLRSSVAT